MMDNSFAEDAHELIISPQPRFELSPYRYMQFMEPLGTTDGSVEAAWDFQRDCWRPDLLEVTRELAPTMLRWGGCYSSYYRWREGVGPRSSRVPMHNLLWGGIESNQVGTHEFVDFCRQVGAEPLLAINFESDGRRRWAQPQKGGLRSAGPDEAAAWVDYCNRSNNPLRCEHGHPKPYDVRFWQIGNETSYDPEGYDMETAARRTLAFARAMRQVDPSIVLIGWGDSDWAPRILEVAGQELQYVAIHHMWSVGGDDPDWDWRYYRRDAARTWDLLINACKPHEAKIARACEQLSGSGVGLALTECHLSLPGRNRCEALSSWAAGAAYARVLNGQARHGDILKIATAADFCGTRWMVNAIMIPTPQGRQRCYMMPVARVMALFRRHEGGHALDIEKTVPDLDITASRSEDRVYLHVVNTRPDQDIAALLRVAGHAILSGRGFEIAADPMLEMDETQPDSFSPTERALPPDGVWRFPAASVTALALELRPMDGCRWVMHKPLSP